MRVTDTASFIVKSNIVHSNRYDYSQSVYTRQKDKLKIDNVETILSKYREV